jgi:tetratricopeptide (TPR) repeat protein
VVLALVFPYLSVREVSIASSIQARNPEAALRDLGRAADLNPLSSAPGQLAGTIALRTGQYALAARRFKQAIARERGAWYPWLGAGLAASALGNQSVAHDDFTVAASINSLQPAVSQALERVYTRHPLTPEQAFRLFVVLPG